MRIYLGADHAGFKLKERVKEFLKKKYQKYQVIDLGTNSEKSVDYPDYAINVAENVSHIDKDGSKRNDSDNVNNDKGILICGSGIGMSIAANKVSGAKAAVARAPKDAELSRKHNDANILCLGGRLTSDKKALKIVDTFLITEFDGNKEDGYRHKRRVDKFLDIEKRYCKC